MAKKTTFTGFDNIMSTPKDSVALSQDALNSNTPAARPTKGASAGCKEGHTRHTYVMPIEMINKLKAIGGYLGKSEVSIVLSILEEGIAKYEKDYGSQISDLNRGQQ